MALSQKQLEKQIRPSGGGKDLVIIGMVGLLMIAAFIFFLFKIIGQSEEHVEKVRKTKMKYQESLKWRPDSNLSEKRILQDLKIDPRRRKASYRQLDLSRKSFKYLGRMVSLEDLSLSGCVFKDSWLKYIQNLPLIAFNLSSTNLTDKGTRYISEIDSLRALSLSETEISDHGLKAISNLTNLGSIGLDGTNITDNGVRYLLKLKNLSLLSIANTKLSPISVDKLVESKRLRSLNVQGIYLKRSNVEKIAENTKLHFLTMNNCGLTDEDVAPLTKCGTIQRLKMDRNELSDKSLKLLAKLPQLRFLSVEQCFAITDKGAREFREKKPQCRLKYSPEKNKLQKGIPLRNINEEVMFIEDQVRSKGK